MIPNAVLYSDLPAVSQKIRSRRMKLAGHCGEADKRKRKPGRQRTTYIDESPRCLNELHTAMNNREKWRLRSSMVRTGSSTLSK